jgi:hypothetical protein
MATSTNRDQTAALANAVMPSSTVSTGTIHGEITLRANWERPVDLDIALVDAQGRRISWLGGRASGITAAGIHDPRDESLGLSRASVGNYFVEISRAEAGTEPVSGRIDASVLGEHHALAFSVAANEKTVRVGRITVTRHSELRPVSDDDRGL